MPTAAFEDSRRLTGPNRHFAEVGAVLEVLDGVAFDDAMLHRWRANVARASDALAWPHGSAVWRTHAQGASLAMSAPVDQLYTATEVNEWAWLAARHPACDEDVLGYAPAHPAAWDTESALVTLRALAVAEQRPDIITLIDAAQSRGLPVLLDDQQVSIGYGVGAKVWPLSELPTIDQIPWPSLHAIPTALVTGSNGKTTVVRLLAAIAQAHGWRVAHSCTDGLFFDGTRLDSGDYSGPIGARSVLRVPQAEAAILETARGGILRRGLGVRRADVAVVTNISADHYGEYGVNDLAGLAEAKMTVARAIDATGLLVLNADDALLVARSGELNCPLGWFALDDDNALLHAHRGRGGATCAVRDGRLCLHVGTADHDLGGIGDMPLSFAGQARYNIANLAAASLAAVALGIAPKTIAATLAKFGARRDDNPGRLQFWSLAGLRVFVDYAHNPDGLRSLLEVAIAQRSGARLGLTLAQPGNRGDAEIREQAVVAAGFKPDRVMVTDIDGYLRGREPGEVPALLANELRRWLPDDSVKIQLDESMAARDLLAWSRAGDVLVMPILGQASRAETTQLLDRLQTDGWSPGDPLPGHGATATDQT